MAKYLAKYIRLSGDEDPASDVTFDAADDHMAMAKARLLGRPGDEWDVLKLVGTVKHPREKT